MKQKAAILIPLIALLCGAPGCSSQHQTAAAGDQDLSWASQGQAEDKFLNDVASLPMDQRKDYVLNHRDELNQLQTDPDKSKLAKLDSLLPPEIP
jgi:hypothetical protein